MKTGGPGIGQFVKRWATDWMAGVRFPAGAKPFSLLQIVQTGSGFSHLKGTGGSFSGGKEAGTCSWPVISI
jgi:hypothetical protein